MLERRGAVGLLTLNRPDVHNAVNADMASVLAGAVFDPGRQLGQDNQEIVDLFEAAMRTVAQRPAVALFLWSVSLSENVTNQDPLRQPALANAVALYSSLFNAACLVGHSSLRVGCMRELDQADCQPQP